MSFIPTINTVVHTIGDIADMSYTLLMKLLLKKTYLQIAKDSVGAKLFQTLLADIDGEEVNILKGGDVSCAFFVSALLKMFDLVTSPHATVSGLEKDLIKNNWNETKELTPGAIIIWEETSQAGDEMHEHVGIYLGDNMAVSNSYKELTPVTHTVTGVNSRPIRIIYTHSFLV